MFVVDPTSPQGNSLTYLRSQEKSVDLWHRRIEHASISLLNKLTSWDLVHGLPKTKFRESKDSDICVKEKQTKSSFKSMKVSTSRPLEDIHVDLCGPMKIQSR